MEDADIIHGFYCPTCGSCGEMGCCNPLYSIKKHIKGCLYADVILDEVSKYHNFADKVLDFMYETDNTEFSNILEKIWEES